jgi:DNA-binding MarR family transcriptional regulator
MVVASLERAAHLIGAYLERAARDLGVTQAEAHVLAQLARHGALPIADLHREFGTKRSTLTNVLDRLEAKRLVRREVNSSDRRSFTIHLTRTGSARGRRLVRAIDELEARLQHEVTRRELEAVEAVVAALAAATN